MLLLLLLLLLLLMLMHEAVMVSSQTFRNQLLQHSKVLTVKHVSTTA